MNIIGNIEHLNILGVDYEVSESTAHYIVSKIEKILIKESQFHLQTLKHAIPVDDANEIEVVVVDVTESQCEKPKKSKNYTTQVKKKKHTQKTQIITTLTGKILAVTVDKGRIHDFKLFKQSKATKKYNGLKNQDNFSA